MQQLLSNPYLKATSLLGPLLAIMFLLELSPNVISGVLLSLALLLGILSLKNKFAAFPASIFLLFAILIASGSTQPALYYPVLINLIVFCFFFFSMFQPLCLIQKIALRMDANLPPDALRYCYGVNVLWTVFSAVNMLISFLTVRDIKLWSWYNGLISYILIALLFISEYAYRCYYRRTRNATLLLIFLIFASSAQSCPLIEGTKAFSSPFKQTRIVTGLKKPIISSGNFTLTPGKEVIWETLKPFYVKVVISEDGFKVQDFKAQDVVYADGPLRELGTILLKMHSGDLKPLEEQFSFKCVKEKDQNYHFLAQPKQVELSKIFKEIEIIGALQPEQIVFTDARGDKCLVEFSK